ncbi:hypothetical protein Glove_426g60 [Diversispora epigaea]|uniref:Uncharacterized protein n=1 Tax=Diversispora epigaea TaxID=1348612 RepID=A0A397H2F7_9GLOM|nr:hypothetical protein Glove_426g60 [Diversispora epigaea]
MRSIFFIITSYLLPTVFIETCSHICHFFAWIYFCKAVYPICYLAPAFSEHIPPPKRPTTRVGTFVMYFIVIMASLLGQVMYRKQSIEANRTKSKTIKLLEEKLTDMQIYQKRRITKVSKYYEQELEKAKIFHEVMVEIMAEDIANLRLELKEIRKERDRLIKKIKDI